MKEQTILFSIIIPTYNRVELLQQAVESILAQASSQVEMIIVDDGSTDDTSQMVANLGHNFIKYFRQENGGQSAARNFGVTKASGEYVIFMDDDDDWLPGHLEQFESAIGKEEQPHCIYRTGFKRLYPDGKMILAPNYNAAVDGHPVNWAAFNMCALVCLCIPRKFLQSEKSPIGFPHWQDSHLILRLLAKHPFKQLNGHTYIYRIHPDMGSLKKGKNKAFSQRAAINVAAIADLFEKHGDVVNPYLPNGTKVFLIAEKYMEYANLELKIGSRKDHWGLLKRSLTTKLSPSLWKHYVLFLKYLILR